MRLPVNSGNRFSDDLEQLLRRNHEFLGCRSLYAFDPQSMWDNASTHFLLGWHRESRLELVASVRSGYSAKHLAYLDSKEELFAEALALAVLNPPASYALDRELHARLTEIVRAEFLVYFPELLLEDLLDPMMQAEAVVNADLERNSYLRVPQRAIS